MARRIELTDTRLVAHYSGFDALLRLRRGVAVPYSAIRSVRIGFEDLPGALAIRIGLTTAPLGRTRRGTFWWNGRRLFLDFANPDRAVMLELTHEHDDAVAIEPDTNPNDLAERIRERRAGPLPAEPAAM
jgi:hypothetical protein